MNKTIEFDQGRYHQIEIDASYCRMTNAEIMLMAGDMTPQELRCVQAVLHAVERKIKGVHNV